MKREGLTLNESGRRGSRGAGADSPGRRLGVDGRRPLYGNVGASKILRILGPEMFAPVTAEQVPGRIVWCNFELARELGFDVPPSNLMTPEFHARLVDALSYRAVGPGETTGGGKVIRIYADRYGGAGVSPALGSARSAFLKYGNLLLKGVGFTPLFKHDNEDDFAHSTGLMPLGEGQFEAVFGEVNDNLFTHGTTRVLALIDQDRHLVYPDGKKRLCAVAVRAGTQLRPGHVLAARVPRKNFRLGLFVAITRETGQLVRRRGAGTTPDLKATMLRVVDDHALAAAELFRWRMLHGAISSSNMEMGAAMLDLATQTSQPRTAPIRILTWDTSVYGLEHVERANQLEAMYRPLLRSIPAPRRRRLNAVPVDIHGETARRYEKHLPPVLLRAAGLKGEVAARVNATAPALARRFTATIAAMARLRNPGSMKASRSRPLGAGASVLDVFNLLRVFPPKYFADPEGAHGRSVRDALKPVFKGNRWCRAKNRAAVRALAGEFESAYRELLGAAEAFAEEYYGGRRNMRASVAARAAFENRPLTELYFSKLFREFRAAEGAYAATRDAGVFGAAVDGRIADSLRNVDSLLAQGATLRTRAGVYEVERRTIAGVGYAVRAWDDGRQKRLVRACVPVRSEGGRYDVPLFGLSGLRISQVRAFRCRYSTGESNHGGEAAARLDLSEPGEPVLCVEIKSEPYAAGELKVTFYNPAGRASRASGFSFRGYTFAVPDRQELHKLIKRRR
ncbi:MAG: hypothetical protein LC795_20550 [Acidobacteria bacterium]|nr:hypothetical protein [Acidobacteriota bacterium]